ncbi:MAG: T9SS type A sorting domain-containing protein [Bacteroidota bacterium]
MGLVSPTVNLGEDLTLSEGETIVLDVTDQGISYEWSSGETTPTIMVSTAGTYTVTVTNAQGCTATDEIEVTVMTDTQNIIEENLLSVYPNPTIDRITVTIPDHSSTSQTLQLVSANGQVLLQQTLAYQQAQFDTNLRDFPNGLYLIYLITEEGYLVRKVVKE